MDARAGRRGRRQLRRRQLTTSAQPAKQSIEELPVVHAVTNDEIMLRPGFLRKAMGIMKVLEGKGAIHIRSQLLDSPTLYSIALALLELHEQTKCWCIVNDRVDIALACGVQGVQLTHKSISVPDVQRIAPAMLIGATVHSPAEAKDAEQAGAASRGAGPPGATAPHPGGARRGNKIPTPALSPVGDSLLRHIRSPPVA